MKKTGKAETNMENELLAAEIYLAADRRGVAERRI